MSYPKRRARPRTRRHRPTASLCMNSIEQRAGTEATGGSATLNSPQEPPSACESPGRKVRGVRSFAPDSGLGSFDFESS